MRTPTILAAGMLCAAMLPATVALADVSIDARIRTVAPLNARGASTIVIHATNERVGVCGLTGTVQVFGRSRPGEIPRPLCVFDIARSSVLGAGSSPIGLHNDGSTSDCLGPSNTANPLVVVDLAADPGVIVKFLPGNGEPSRGRCNFREASYTFCTEDNTSAPCVPVQSFRLNINAQ